MKPSLTRSRAILFYLLFAVSLFGNWVSRDFLKFRLWMLTQGAKVAPLAADENHEFSVRSGESKQQMVAVMWSLMLEAVRNPPKKVRGQLVLQQNSFGKLHAPALYLTRHWEEDSRVVRLAFIGLPIRIERSDGELVASRR